MKSQKDKILHQHLIKCGGTSVNKYFALKFFANKVLDSGALRNLSLSQKSLVDSPSEEEVIDINLRLIDFRFNHYDMIHGHSPLVWKANGEHFSFVILRDPVDRVVSQIKDWKRLSDKDLEALPKTNKEFKQFSRENSIDAILDNWDTCELSINNLKNMQSNLLYKAKVGYSKRVRDVDDLSILSEAKNCLNQFDYVGITESLHQSVVNICYLNRWCPPVELPRINFNSLELEVNEESVNKIKALNNLDLDLYDSAKKIANKNDYSFYDIDYFEKHFAEDRTSILSPYFKDGEYLFDFNSPLIGNGFHTRDAANTEQCAIWTGSGVTSTLFFPVVNRCSINVLLYLKGYADPSIKESIKISIDGVKTDYTFKGHDGVDAVLVAKHITTRNFVKVEIEIHKTFSTKEDPRKRGISLLKYGYSCNY